MSLRVVSLGASDLTGVQRQLQRVGVKFESPRSDEPHVHFRSYESRVSGPSFTYAPTTLDFSSRHVTHVRVDNAHGASPSRRDESRKRQVRAGVLAALGAFVASFLIGRAIVSFKEAKEVREYLYGYTACPTEQTSRSFRHIRNGVDSMANNRLWSLINRVVLVVGLVLLAGGFLLPAAPLVLVGGVLAMAATISGMLRLGIFGFEGRQQTMIRDNFGALKEQLTSSSAYYGEPTAPDMFDTSPAGGYPAAAAASAMAYSPAPATYASAYPTGTPGVASAPMQTVYGQVVGAQTYAPGYGPYSGAQTYAPGYGPYSGAQ